MNSNKKFIEYLQQLADKDDEKLLTENDLLFIKELIQKDEEARKNEEESNKKAKKNRKKNR